MNDFSPEQIVPMSENRVSVEWLGCEPSKRIVNKEYWQSRMEEGLTSEELCYFVKIESLYSMDAWKLLVQQGASLDHFKHVAVKSLQFQPLALKYIHDHHKSKEDLLFVIERSEELAYSAIRKCLAAYVLTPQELCRILSILGEDLQIELLVLMRMKYKYKHNAATLDNCGSGLPKACSAFFDQIRFQTEEGLRNDLQSERRKNRIRAAQRLMRQFPSAENCARAISAIETDAISRWTQPIAATCCSPKGINWRQACTLLPENPPVACNECVELLVTLGNKRDALRAILIYSKGFRRFAAASLLNMQPVLLSDITLILAKAPYRYRKRATQILLSRKGVSLHMFVLAWRRTYDMRTDIERILLNRKSDERMKAHLQQKAPDLLVRLDKHRGHS